uniref:CCHC-type domain-containing protein n=1 Tax=Chromera velia CCMP2878 TaxID=1169474 RepID=A0A0G4FHR2_9ALVE|eukprot:Cvel_17020.t1-p1 / transcript=Cvel_17020.t1 / gene=Cvel_17020 / organism=Chromera_velia_CCMP2878 / gene_product=hypothetical protein / transcript_product=hypothetical protein / location=Cvel_scaffold1338:28283-29289(-) / protein_length=210 / sequence_SO=supercontig / SO=protein_coding / is_pseudo=false
MHGGYAFGMYGQGGFNSHFRGGHGGMRGRGGHYQQYGGNNGFNNGPPRCYTCNQPGHKAFNCPGQGNDPDVDRPAVGLSAVGQTGVSVVGEIMAKFSHPSLPKKAFPHRLTITEDSGYKAVLGQDFLKLLDPVVQYHYREDRLDVADLPSFEVWYEDGRKPMRVSAFTRTKVPKRARALVRVQVEGTEGEETVILRKNYPRGFPGFAIPD